MSWSLLSGRRQAAASSAAGRRRAGAGSMPPRVVLARGTHDEDVPALVQAWLALDPDPTTRREAQSWLEAGQHDLARERLTTRLEFGTAGLRGRMGAGYNAMNAVVVQQTTQGLCRYLQQAAGEQLAQHGVVIGYDGRHNSRRFAQVAAAVFLSQGVSVALFGAPVPTPYVAAGVAELRAAGGVCITASHNPKADNGYKVYFGNGCQIIPPHDQGIAEAILANLPFWAPLPDLQQAGYTHSLLSDPFQRVQAAYLSRLTLGVVARTRAANAIAAPVTYTPLHGVGAAPVCAAFAAAGLPQPHLVPAQAEPDPDFPTVSFPNPEEGADTWALAFQEGAANGSRLVLANDPDADRLAAAEAADPGGGYRAFTGNEIGALLAWWLWTQRRAASRGAATQKPVAMLASVVSSAWLGAMAAVEGFRFEQTLTGFKWLGNRALELEAEGYEVVFAYEEAIGFMPGGMYRDKDGISAAVALAEAAAELYGHGSSLARQLDALYGTYGTPVFRSGYFIADAPAKTRAVFERLRSAYPTHIAGAAVEWVRDLGTGLDSSQPDGRARLPWRAGNMMVTFGVVWQDGADGGVQLHGVLTLRASGTEPKLKYYLEVLSGPGQDAAPAVVLADALAAAADTDLVCVDASGLTRPRASAVAPA